MIDADAITREMQVPGTAVFEAMVERFGPGILADDGTLNRQAVADIVFTDPNALAELSGIVHPAVNAEIAARLVEEAETDHLVVLDVPLLIETGLDDLAAVVVVDVDPEVAVQRLVQQRDMAENDVRARMARQISRADRLARADIVLDNSGTLEELSAQLDRSWAEIAYAGGGAEANAT